MKKRTGWIIAASILAALAIAAAIVVPITLKRQGQEPEPVESQEPTEEPIPDIDGITWYDPGQEEFTITDAEMLLDLAKLSYHYDFAGQTVKLGADIVINDGDASAWEDEAPNVPWIPIREFAGTFDGQGHTVSGLYCRTSNFPTAMFVFVQPEAEIRDFRLENSAFFTSGNLGSASIAADCAGTFRRIYSNAIVRCNYGAVGGIVSHQSGKILVEECWFDGALSTTYRTIGGIADQADGAEMEIKHCLNTGSIYDPYSRGACNAGGIAGMTFRGARLVIEDCFSSGTLELGNISRSGSILGGGDSTSGATLINTFAVLERYRCTVSTIISNKSGGAIPITEKNTIGIKAYQWTDLDFDNYWACEENSHPVLKCFAKQPLSTDDVDKEVDYDWYSASKDELLIRTLPELYAFALLSHTTDYASKIIRLENDFELNEGNAEEWIETAPENIWYPVQYFAGALDGQGHTISGLYASGISELGLISRGKGTAGVRNLRLVNSLFKASGDASGMGLSGAIIGRGGGSLDSIYTDAIVYASGAEIGGLIGQINLTGVISSINNCWFDGKVIAVGEENGFIAGGFVGGHALGTLNITHSLFTGTVHTEVHKGSRAGGFIGSVMNTTLVNIGDCLSAGTLDTANPNWVGGGIGTIATDSAVHVKQSYARRECMSNYMGEYVSHISIAEEPKSTGGTIPVYEANLIGTNAYVYTNLNFDRFWALRSDGVPVPAVFKTEEVSTEGLAKAFSTDWYTKGEGGTILTLQDYIGFNMLSFTTNFKGETVKLGADITVNSGSASSWTSAAPALRTIPMGSFAGMFDGQGHALTGVYQRDPAKLGLFSQTEATATIKNLRLLNSFFDATGFVYGGALQSRSGSIVAQGGGRLDTIFSNAIIRVAGQVTGGIIGWVNVEANNRMNNLWFAGSITATDADYGYFAGGIAGATVLGNNRIDHCLYTGSIQTAVANKGSKVGGMVGSVQSMNTLTVNDCLSAGSFACNNLYYLGAIMGTMYSGNRVVITNCFADEGSVRNKQGQFVSAAKNDQVTADELQGEAIPLSSELLEGLNGYRWTSLDFKNYWAAREGLCPGLRSFSAGMDVSGVKQMLDTSWYNASQDTYVIDSAEDLYGLQVLSFSTDFAGKTVKLGADIALNDTPVSSWGENPPENQWSPLSTFAGTLDGQGHTISGIYVTGDTAGTGFIGTLKGTVKDLRIENSLFETSGDDVGALAGKTVDGATIDSVYSDVIIRTSNGYNVGGLVGAVRNLNGDAKTTLTNCWFAGQVLGVGGYNLGGLVGAVVNPTSTLVVDNCLMSGAVTTEDKRSVGGVFGRTMTQASAEISNTLVSGAVTSGGGGQTGFLTGFSNGNVTVQNVYAVSSIEAPAIGTGTSTGAAKSVSDSMLKGAAGYQNTKLDFTEKPYWAAVEDSTPVLYSHYSGTAVDLAGVDRLDDDWFDPESETLVIRTVEELLTFASVSKSETFAGKTVLLDADIDLNPGWMASETEPERVFMMIGQLGSFFQGIFDGQNHTISGIYIKNTTAIRTGFFAGIDNGAVIKNLTIANSYISSDFLGADNVSRIGAVVGDSFTGGAGGTLQNVHVLSDVTVTAPGLQVGGLVGATMGAFKAEDCSVAATVSGSNATGGIVGAIVNASHTGAVRISGCTVNGSINGNENVGGLVGQLGRTKPESCTITDCRITAAITGSQRVGGAIGYINNGTAVATEINSIESSAVITGTGKPARAGGIIGFAGNGDLRVSDCRFDGSVSQPGSNLCGGIIGQVSGAKARVSECVSVGTLEAGGMAGTIVGYTGSGTAEIADCLGLVSGIATAVCSGVEKQLTFTNSVAVPVGTNDGAGQTFAVSSAKQLGMVEDLAGYSSFNNVTITLASDIDLNPGWTPSETAPENEWTMIGSEAHPFMGTFNGLGHAVKGIYAAGETAGFFGRIDGATIEDLRIRNAYISANGAAGAVAASVTGDAVIHKVYSDATVKSSGGTAGGLFGEINGNATVTVSQFDGTVFGEALTGGIVGELKGASSKATIGNTLVSGTVQVSESGQVGGILGGAASGAEMTLQGALISGNVAAERSGAFVGNGSALGGKIERSYAVTGRVPENAAGTAGESIAISATFLPEADLLGTLACDNTELDFASAWGAVENATPVLKAFYDGTLIDVSGSLPVVISTAQELIAFANDSKENNYEGRTVRLEGDIDLNPSWTASATAPETTFPMIGSASVPFKGTFNGNGYTVSGIYVKNTASMNTGFFVRLDGGAEVKNLTIDNSYFESTDTSSGGSAIGAVAGSIGGTGATLNNVELKSDVQVKGAGNRAGGFVGSCEALLTIENCRTAAAVYGAQYVGGVIGIAATAAETTVKDVSVTGIVTGGSYVGGIIGQIQSANTLITGCTVDSEVRATQTASGSPASVGCVVGSVEGTGTRVESTRVQGLSFSAAGYEAGGMFGTVKANTTVFGCRCSSLVYIDTNGANVGGIAGAIRGTTTLTVEQTEFAGTVKTSVNHSGGGRLGGFVGTVMNGGSALVVMDCLMSGSVTSDKKLAAGGIAGYSFTKGASCTVTRSLITGTVTTGGGGQTGSVGGSTNNLKITAQDVYALDTACTVGTNGVGTSENMNGTVTVVTQSSMSGENAKTTASALNFDSVWKTTETLPALRALSE